jgi:prepilin-type N-terminal cleavage/methylation domain-containing protein
MRISDGIEHPQRKERIGYSLAEVMIAMALFGIMATGFLASCLFARKAAESAACENAALCVAQGYMEQMKSNSYSTLAAIIATPTVPIPTMTSVTVADYIYQNAYTTKTVVMRRDTSGNTVQTLNVSVMPVISDVTISSISAQAVGIVIYYRWTDPITNQTLTRTIRGAKANIN